MFHRTLLPGCLSRLSALRELALSNNQLASLPNFLGELTQLSELYLHGNSLLGIPEELLGPTHADVFRAGKGPKPPKTILECYFRSRQGRSLNEAKLILVGRGVVGKTSLVKRLVHDTFDPGAAARMRCQTCLSCATQNHPTSTFPHG